MLRKLGYLYRAPGVCLRGDHHSPEHVPAALQVVSGEETPPEGHTRVPFMEGFIVEEVYFVRAFHSTWTWKSDESFLNPESALNRAQKLSGELDCQVAVSCDARNWVDFLRGSFYRSQEWEDFYSGEPSEAYKKLKKVLNERCA